MNELAPRPVNDVRKLETEDAEQIVKVRPRRNAWWWKGNSKQTNPLSDRGKTLTVKNLWGHKTNYCFLSTHDTELSNLSSGLDIMHMPPWFCRGEAYSEVDKTQFNKQNEWEHKQGLQGMIKSRW